MAVVLLLPGQGSQHPGMCAGLYGTDPVFTAVLDEYFGLLGAVGSRLRDTWLTGRGPVPLDDASVAQPLLFGLDYAIGRALWEHGVRPVAYLGHSVGELAAAALAGVFDPPAAARFMLARCAALEALPPGGMLAVGVAPEALADFVDPWHRPDGVVVGACNAPRQTVLCGPQARLAEVAGRLREAGIGARAVPALQPFHSPAAVAPAEALARAVTGEALRPAERRVQSTVTARALTAAEAVDPGFWARNVARTVQFWPALDALLGDESFADESLACGPALSLVEAGPGQGLSMLARRHPQVRRGRASVVPGGADLAGLAYRLLAGTP